MSIVALWTASGSSSFSSSTSDSVGGRPLSQCFIGLIQAHVVDDHPIDHAVLTEGDAVRQLQGCACWAAAAIGGYASEPDEPG
jgi:hypothetical protein